MSWAEDYHKRREEERCSEPEQRDYFDSKWDAQRGFRQGLQHDWRGYAAGVRKRNGSPISLPSSLDSLHNRPMGNIMDPFGMGDED